MQPSRARPKRVRRRAFRPCRHTGDGLRRPPNAEATIGRRRLRRARLLAARARGRDSSVCRSARGGATIRSSCRRRRYDLVLAARVPTDRAAGEVSAVEPVVALWFAAGAVPGGRARPDRALRLDVGAEHDGGSLYPTCSLGPAGIGAFPFAPAPASSASKRASACENSVGIIQSLFESPWAIWGSICRYW